MYTRKKNIENSIGGKTNTPHASRKVSKRKYKTIYNYVVKRTLS